jgi:GrpB-like predicted nucleotidyltransferase (UPF0157 family)
MGNFVLRLGHRLVADGRRYAPQFPAPDPGKIGNRNGPGLHPVKFGCSTHTAWAGEFELERVRILNIVGDRILEIQHVGSTAIPGVPAKPVLDILVGVEDFDEASVCVAPLENIGYRYRGEYGISRRHYFVKGDPRTHHLHMVEKDSDHWTMTMAFRDFLKRDSESARAYAEAKRSLAAEYSLDREAYQREKDKVVERLLALAKESCGGA